MNESPSPDPLAPSQAAPRFAVVVSPSRAGGRQWMFVVLVAAAMAGAVALLAA